MSPSSGTFFFLLFLKESYTTFFKSKFSDGLTGLVFKNAAQYRAGVLLFDEKMAFQKKKIVYNLTFSSQKIVKSLNKSNIFNLPTIVDNSC
jgi:hypothetical protein